MLDGAAALDAGEEVHRSEEFVRAGQVEEDGVNCMAGELGFEPAGVLDRALNDGDFVRRGDGGFESGGVAGWEDECFHSVGLDEQGDELGADVAGGGCDEDVGHVDDSARKRPDSFIAE